MKNRKAVSATILVCMGIGSNHTSNRGPEGELQGSLAALAEQWRTLTNCLKGSRSLLKNPVQDPASFGRGSVSSCKFRAPILSRDQRKRFPGLFQQTPRKSISTAS